ncbi:MULTISPECIES: DUF5064 family protein [Pseudomonadaceae]|uniref:DUF5064 family protein n=1 Tax=Pseudomonas denitrificans TaxID=43306 RepID=A0A9X7N158_PSEDE|nr:MULTISPECIES: DUF5064 family protein [Pseudomonadaceae]OQR37058.1 DUF5064 domain-containing protein [Pseudomonas sp. T]MBD9512902.1 DUF5064 family protein [Pseudomonas sp. PDM22]MBD9630590.1 DUF5064 family protein [Pseudomonas sp. PDM19]MBD9681306.1 DUF5064 family protein [Pseudomonas sp. PDM20]QEY73126.1 DUF5064 family protein [Pseudomonas denitrificans (nom. rej.)]
MFEPGHLHLQSLPGLGQQEIDAHINYEVRKDVEKGTIVHFTMKGEIDGNSFTEEWDMPKEQAFNFASDATRIAQKHGLHPRFGSMVRNHKEYDAMFEDIRQKLGTNPGDPIDLDKVIHGDS